MRKTIAIDIDDVLASHAQAFVDFSNERWGTNLTVDDYDDDWAILWQFDRHQQEHRDEMDIRAGEFFAAAISPMDHIEDAHDVLLSLKQDYDLVVVTSRRQQIKGDTLVWLKEKFAGVFEEDKIFFAGFYDVNRAESAYLNKGDILRDLKVDYLIDDQPKHCNGAAEHGVQALLFGMYGWQDDALLNDAVVRVSDWHAVKEYFNAEQQRISN